MQTQQKCGASKLAAEMVMQTCITIQLLLLADKGQLSRAPADMTVDALFSGRREDALRTVVHPRRGAHAHRRGSRRHVQAGFLPAARRRL